MLSEDFDKRIREAAEHHHPAYDEKAWKGMKQLLDKHMPEKEEKKRRFLFFILLFLLLGGGVWMATGGLNTRGKKQTSVTTQPKEPISKPPSAVDVNNNKGSVPVKSGNDKKEIATYKNDDKEKDETAVNIKPDNKTFNPQLNFQNPNKKEKKSGSGLNKKIKEKVSPAEKDITGKQGNPADEPHIKVKSEPVVIASGKGPGDDKTVENPETAGNKKPFASAAPKDATENKTLSENKQPVNGNIPGNEENNSRETVTRKPKQGSAKKNSFFFSTSLMPDVSFTGGDPLGKMKLLRGAGIGYTIRDKFTLRTGFYSGRKVYESSPEQYNPPPQFYTYYPYLEKVEADCKVYEIPVLLSYQIGEKRKHSWFVSAGVSTLIMKRETYDYYYKYTPTGPVVHRAYTFNNENSHLFSLATLSAGYQRQIGNKVSLTTEPYFKLPLSGVGYGKVKLNSTGIMFTVAVKPFQGNVKKQ